MRKLEIKISEKDYALALNRNAVKWLEANGFVIEDFDRKPTIYYDLLWYSLFIEYHPEVNPKLALKLMDTYKSEGNSVGNVVKFAIEEYQAFINALTDIDTEAMSKMKITEI